jgi:hypothetical protein
MEICGVSGSLLDGNQHYRDIAQADIVVAEMTGLNANVFYEVGYAHALGKLVILLTSEAAQIPFDLSQYQHIVHKGDPAILKKALVERLRLCKKNGDIGGGSHAMPMRAFVSESAMAKQMLQSLPREWGSRCLYLGLGGAKNWIDASRGADYHRASYAREIVRDVITSDFLDPVDATALVSLGVGDGSVDKFLCVHLAKKGKATYVPVDINPYLLSCAIRETAHAATTIASVVCDFEEEMDGYLKTKLESCGSGPRLFSLLGFTFCNIDSLEARFLFKLESLLKPGDHLILDFLVHTRQWNLKTFCADWCAHWDPKMRRLLCDGWAKRTGEKGSELADSFETRFDMRVGLSDVPTGLGTHIADALSGETVVNLRRYSSLKKWVSTSNLAFAVIHEKIVKHEQGAGRGYLLVKRT